MVDCDAAIRLEPRNADCYNLRGRLWSAKNRPIQAIADQTEAIRLEPKHSMAYVDRGMVRRRQQQYESALADFTDAIRLEPRGFEAYYNRAVIKLLLGRDGAVTDTKAALEYVAWRGAEAIYASILGHFSALRERQADEAKALLEAAPPVRKVGVALPNRKLPSRRDAQSALLRTRLITPRWLTFVAFSASSR